MKKMLLLAVLFLALLSPKAWGVTCEGSAGSYTVALSSTTGVVYANHPGSVGITLTGKTGLWITSSGTVGTKVGVRWSSDNITFTDGGTVSPLATAQCIGVGNTYVKFVPVGTLGGIVTVSYATSQGIVFDGMGDLSTTATAIGVDAAAIEVLATAGNVDLAAIEVTQGALVVDAAAIEVLATAGNVDLAAIEVTQDALVVDAAAIEVLVTAGNVDLAAIEVTQDALVVDVAAMKVDLAALEVLVTAGNVDLAALETLGDNDAAGWTYKAVSLATTVNTSAWVVNVSSVAGVATGKFKVLFEAVGPDTYVLYQYGATSSVTPVHYLAISTTSSELLNLELSPGSHIGFQSPTSGNDVRLTIFQKD